MADFSTLKIIEIGHPWVKLAFPRQTVCYSTLCDSGPDDPSNGLINLSARTLPQLWRALREPDLSLIVCRPPFYPPWHWQWLSRELFSRRALRGHSRLLSGLATQFLRFSVSAPIAVTDTADYPAVNSDAFFLLRYACVYFKSELPSDHWRVFTRTAHANLPTPRFRRKKHWQNAIAKIRPLALGLPTGATADTPQSAPTKTADVFFSGAIEGSSTVRVQGIGELMALRERGVVVDIPEGRLSRKDFYERMAGAWLAWSPEGLGWDCFRHYEAPACGAVPVVNQPGIAWHMPLIPGQHAFFYNPVPGGLSETILAALADKKRLQAMAAAGRAHVLTHHTNEALARYVVETTLSVAASQ